MAEVFIHDVKIKGESQFAQKFNDVSDAWEACANADPNDPEKEKELLEEFIQKKIALEMGF